MIQRRRHMRLIDCVAQELSPPAIRVAFASTDLQHVDQHFGLASGFAIYEISAENYSLIEGAQFDPQKVYQPGHSEDKLTDKISLIEGCMAVYSNAVGPSAVKRLLASDIQPLKVDEGTPITVIIEELQQQLAGSSVPGWMQRITRNRLRQQADNSRFDELFDQEWGG